MRDDSGHGARVYFENRSDALTRDVEKYFVVNVVENINHRIRLGSASIHFALDGKLNTGLKTKPQLNLLC